MTTTSNGAAHPSQTMVRPRIEKDDVLAAASGRWTTVFTAVTYIDPASLTTTQKPYPSCGGKARFRVFSDFEETGRLVCNQCGAAGNGIASVMQVTGWDFKEAFMAVAREVGLDQPDPNRPPPDIFDAVSRRKRMPLDAMLSYGAERSERNGAPVVRFPMYDQHGALCSAFDVGVATDALSKGLGAKGKPAGVFLPDGGRLPRPGEIWFMVEGGARILRPPQARVRKRRRPAAERAEPPLHADLPGGADHLRPRPARRGDGVVEQVGRLTYCVATAYLVATLPAEWKETGGQDVQGILARDGGEQLVRQAIEDAAPWAMTGTETPESVAAGGNGNGFILRRDTSASGAQCCSGCGSPCRREVRSNGSAEAGV